MPTVVGALPSGCSLCFGNRGMAGILYRMDRRKGSYRRICLECARLDPNKKHPNRVNTIRYYVDQWRAWEAM